MRGQALVEAALVLPLLLLLTVGIIAVGFGLVMRLELAHAAMEAADAGARDPSQPDRCDTALATLVEVYGRAPDDAACVPAVGTSLQVSASDHLRIGGYAWTIAVSERAVIR